MTRSLIVNEASDELCASDRMQLFAHGEELLSLSSRSGLADCLGSLRAWLDLSEIVVATGAIEKLPDARVICSGYDPEWMELYLRERFVEVDPIVSAIVKGKRFLNRSQAIEESCEVARLGPHRPTLERFLEAAQDYGRLGCGFASGVVFNGHIALCSVITS
ncbi:MAG: autoinducer binding domain-containing protein, partial [Pseudomonadota bacterium]|nr:autoinducer binding domain-containing protein [Pseudomonadota bacterium]